MDTKIEDYKYSPLTRPRSIRVLEGVSDDRHSESLGPSYRLRTIDLDDAACPPYYALSYTWKLPEIEEEQVPERPSPLQIRIDDKVLGIQENLFDFLYQLHNMSKDKAGAYGSDNTDDPGLLWVDAVCVNQKDLEERSSQVAMMQKIYAQAQGTLVWLGRKEKSSHQALVLIKRLAEVEINLPDFEASLDTISGVSQLQDKDFFSSMGVAAPEPSDWNSVTTLFHRSWFHRLWTVQELVISQAHGDVIFLCGDLLISADDLTDFMLLVLRRGWQSALKFNRTRDANTAEPFGLELVIGISSVYNAPRDLVDPDSVSGLLHHIFTHRDEQTLQCAKFAWILNHCRQKQVTDDRDRIFASAGMVSDYHNLSNWHLLSPDYTKSTEDVFRDATVFILQSLGNLSWLAYVQDISLKVHVGLPSWVPDLASITITTALATLGNFDVFQDFRVQSQKSIPPVLLSYGGSLNVKGFKLDEITCKTRNLDNIFLDRKLSELVLTAAQNAVYQRRASWLTLLMETMVVGTPVASTRMNYSDLLSTPRGFEELLPSFISFLKFEIAQEIWMWCTLHHEEPSKWWETHVQFATLCDSSGDLLPSSDDFKEHYSLFSAHFPADHDWWINPTLEDETFLEVLWNPTKLFRLRCGHACRFRSYIETQQGSMGLAPPSSRLKDEIWILVGAKTPFVLREQADGSYCVLGEAYIHGVMHGEIFESRDDPKFEYIVLT